MGDPIPLTQHICGLMEGCVYFLASTRACSSTRYSLPSSLFPSSARILFLHDWLGDDWHSWHILDIHLLDHTSFPNFSGRTFFSRTWVASLVVSKLLVLPLDQYLRPDEHLPDLLPSVLLLCPNLLQERGRC